MTKIGSSTSAGMGDNRLGPASRNELFGAKREAFVRRDGQETTLRDNPASHRRGASNMSTSDRAAAFRKSVRDALDDDPERKEDERPDGEKERVLASAEWSGAGGSPFGAAFPWPNASQAVDGTPVAAALEARVATLTNHIERCLRAELLPGDGQPISIRLPLDGVIEGLRAVTIEFSATGLDVLLTRATAEVSDALLREAQLLAQRLQAKFSKRLVRILDVDSGESPDDSDGASRDPQRIASLGRSDLGT